MYLDYTKIKSGQKKQPMLRLRTLAGKELGVIPFVHNLEFEINYSDISTIQFTTPYKVNGMLNPLYAALTSFKVIYTEEFGIYVLASPRKSGDGVEESKTVMGYSLEQMFKKKDLFLEEGTYNFWNPSNSKDTILGRIIELDPSWSVGYVAPRLISCYRTFDQYDNDALSFCYGDAMEKYSCAFVFDVYQKRINVYDATKDAETLPIYLSYHNLVDSVDVEELSDEIATKVHLSGSDGLTIRDVNPMGTDYIVNLDYFLYNGDLDVKGGDGNMALADKVREWQAAITANQTYYTGLASARASLTAQKLTAQVDLTTMKGELDTLTAQQSVIIQAMAMETTDAGKNKQQTQLNNVNAQISAKNAEIKSQETKIATIGTDIDRYMSAMTAINKQLSFEGYFTAAEREVLSPFMIEASLSDETFVVTDIDTTASGAVSTVSGSVSVAKSNITKVELMSFGKTMYAIAGGTLSVPGANLTAEIMRGTLEVSGSGYVMTAYLGTTNYKDHDFSTGLITISGILSQLSSDVSAYTQDEITEYKGTRFSFQTTNADSYFTVSANDYQKYSVAMELYSFGEEVLDDYAWPVYEFNVDSANFLYHNKFEPFKNKLELGKAVHLELGSEGLINAKIIGFRLNFEDISNFELIFSNRYQKKNGQKFLKDLFNSTSQSKKTINANKYTYNRTADKVTEVSEIIQQQLVAAVNNIVNKEDQTVLINSAGINIGGSSNYQMRLVDNMIAMTDDNWKTAKLAIGLFATKDVGTQWGVNAEMLAGNILIGNKLILQNPNDEGYMMFQIDETGAWLYNAQFVLQEGKTGGLIIIDPKYGIVAGTKLLFDTNGTTVTPEFMDEAGEITFDSEGMPKNANFFLDINTGNAYFRGKLRAKSGLIGGYTIEDSYLHAGSGGTYVGLNGGTSVYADYAMWAGAANPSKAPFYVKKDGTLYAKNGTFAGKLEAATGTFKGALSAATGTFSGALSAATGTFAGSLSAATGTFSGSLSAVNGTFTGTLSAANISGNLTANSGAALVGCAIYVPNRSNPKFSVDSAGNVSMLGNLTLSNGAISWSNLGSGVQNRITNVEQDIYSLSRDISDVENYVDNRLYNFNIRMDGVQQDINWLSNNIWTEREIMNIASTQITNELISSPRIYGAYIQGGTINGANFMFGSFGSIYDGYGSDGVNRTDLACINSNRGMSISASQGMALSAGHGIWITGDVHIRVGGRWVNLNEVVTA